MAAAIKEKTTYFTVSSSKLGRGARTPIPAISGSGWRVGQYCGTSEQGKGDTDGSGADILDVLWVMRSEQGGADELHENKVAPGVE